MHGVWNRRQTEASWVAFDGYLLNRQELRAHLGAGPEASDQELFAQAYAREGQEAVLRCAGAFAFAAWDQEKRELVLGRDHLGGKGMFYADCGDEVVFASEMEAVAAHEAVPDELNLEELLVIGPYYHSFYKHVQEVKPGSLVVFAEDRVQERTYWEPHEEERPRRLDEAVEELRALLQENVNACRTPGVAVILSGGLDSSGLTAMAGVPTYSVVTPGSDGAGGDVDLDAPWVRRVSESLGIPNQEVRVDTPELVAVLSDGPGQSEIETLQTVVLRRVAESCDAVIFGDGADELFGSLDWFYDPRYMERQGFPWLYPMVHRVFLGDLGKAGTYAVEKFRAAVAEMPALGGATEEEARLRKVGYLTLRYYLPYLFRRSERLAKEAGLEARQPFCDPRIAQIAWNLSWEDKNYGGQTKGVLREVFRPFLPADVVDRKKSNAPVRFQDSYAAFLQGELKCMLEDEEQPLHPYLDQEQVQELMEKLTTEGFWRFRMDYFASVNRWLREKTAR